MAVINLPNREEIEYDLNVTIFNVIEPKSQAIAVWEEIEYYLLEGATEEFLYQLMNERIKERG